MVAVLLAVAVAALRAGGTFAARPHPEAAGFSGAVLVTALAAAEGVALIAFGTVLLMARPRRRPHQLDEPTRIRVPWWLKTLGVVVSAFAVAAPLAILLARRARHNTAQNPFLFHPGVPVGAKGSTGSSASGWSLIAGMALALAIVITLALRSRARNSSPHGPRGPQTIADTLASAQAALAGGKTPREAIIACYAAMERGFAAAGSAPEQADTPAEVLTRATTAGILGSASAETLTALFRRARYSDEPMTGADSTAAAGALAQIQAEIR
jgi:hypothetical protein